MNNDLRVRFFEVSNIEMFEIVNLISIFPTVT